jgi:hypothetical protein
MRYSLKQFISYTFVVVILFVLLTHAGGFATGVKALAQGYGGGVKALEGRG